MNRCKHRVFDSPWRLSSSAMLVCLCVAYWPYSDLPCPTVRGAESLREQFMIEAPKHWNTYLDFAKRRLQGDISYKHFEVVNGSKRLYSEGTASYRQNDGCASVVYTGLSRQDKEGQVLAQNRRYAFELSRRAPSSGWLLTKIGTDSPDYQTVDTTPIARTVREAVCAHFLVFDRWLPDWIKDPRFVVKEATSVDNGGHHLVQVDFGYQPRDSKESQISGGRLLFDPERSWVLREYAVTMLRGTKTVTSSVNFQHVSAADNRPIILKVVRVDKSPQIGEPSGEINLEYALQEREVSDADFSLSAYGLPEPIGATVEKQVPVFVWILAASVACALIAIGCRYLGRRK